MTDPTAAAPESTRAPAPPHARLRPFAGLTASLSAHGAHLALSRVRPGVRASASASSTSSCSTGRVFFDTDREAIMALQTDLTGSDDGRR
ncbi:hypothetical protein ACPPVW_12525 [Leifsonia sp. McL0607]|uniref:hypothetical protein n=1 Tax=Leifsonia sp. McL0607 TaxID=3415672 RepID=UPI003CE9AFA1